MSYYLTEDIKYNLVYLSNRTSDEDRAIYLLSNLDYYYYQLKHFQQLTNSYRMFLVLISHWRTFKDIQYLLIIGIVIMQLGKYDDVVSGDPTKLVYMINYVVTIVQLVLSGIIVICCCFERLPISISLTRGTTNANQILYLKKKAGMHVSLVQNVIAKIFGAIEKYFKF